MAGSLKDVLSRIVKELDDEEVREEFEALKGKKLTIAELREVISEAPAEERAQLRELLREEGIEPEPPGGNGGKKKKTSAADTVEPAPDEEEPPGGEPPARRKRPGRKSGAAYDWFVDDDGNVVRSNVAIVYSGEDEPDEVEMLDLEEVPADAEVESATE